MLGCEDRTMVNGNGMDVLLNDIWDWNFIGNFVGLQNFYFFNDGHFNDLHVGNLLRVMLVVGVMWILRFNVPGEAKSSLKQTREENQFKSSLTRNDVRLRPHNEPKQSTLL